MQREHGHDCTVVVGDEKAPAPLDLMRKRARNFANRKLLASSSPVETQLFIQTRAISSCSSMQAGRITIFIAGTPTGVRYLDESEAIAMTEPGPPE